MPTTISRFADEHLFLSTFAYSPITLPTREGMVQFLSVAHGWNYAKSLDPHYRAKVVAAGPPGEAQAHGEQVTPRPDWDESMRFRVMEDCLRAKFHPGSQFADQLLSTGEALLIDGNTRHDNLWGDCQCGHPACRAPGANVLGRMLMSLRDELRFPSDMRTPLSAMTGIPGLCRVPPAQVPNELVTAVTQQSDLAEMLAGADLQVVLARLLEIFVPPIVASGERTLGLDRPLDPATHVILPRPAVPGQGISGRISHLDVVPGPRGPRLVWRVGTDARGPVEVRWDLDEAESLAAHMGALTADVKRRSALQIAPSSQQ
ncbi:NADAR family protein [Nonomuraea sp. NPDC049784]|uniref:NADAR family protein n=1 Tax=Nonomuraea sp. NPDC049784 TaxID=3154361 RepID=UPI0033F3EB24